MANVPSFQQEELGGGLTDAALSRLRQGEKQEQFAAQNRQYGSEQRRQKFKDLATAAAEAKTRRGVEYRGLRIKEDEQKRLTEQFNRQMKLKEQQEATRQREIEQQRADAYQARKDAEPGFIGSLFGK